MKFNMEFRIFREHLRMKFSSPYLHRHLSVPGVVSNTQMNLVSRTTYDRDVNDRATMMYGMQKPSAHSRGEEKFPFAPWFFTKKIVSQGEC